MKQVFTSFFGGKWTSKKMCSFPNLNILLPLLLIYPLAFRLKLQCGLILPVIMKIQAIPVVKAHPVMQSEAECKLLYKGEITGSVCKVDF